MRRRTVLAGLAASLAARNDWASPPAPGPARQSLSGFQARSGFSVSGKFAWDQDITITNAANPFGSTGPTLILFDDFRGGTPGTQVANNAAPVAGTSAWQSSNGRFGNPIYESGNRSGSGNCIRIYNSNNTYTPYQLQLNFASTTGIYVFWAENSHGGDYNTFTNNFGNPWNYKMHWFLQNLHAGAAFNEWLPALFDGTGTWMQQFASNDVPPLPNWFVADPSKWDPNNWNSVEVGFVGNAANPTGAPGRIYISLYSPKNNGQWTATNTSLTLFNSGTRANGDYASANWLTVPGMIQGVPAGVIIDRADYYVAIGPNAYCRFLIGNGSTIRASTSIMPCTPKTWSAGSWQITLRQGAAPSSGPAGWYLYGSDSANNISLVGQFT